MKKGFTIIEIIISIGLILVISSTAIISYNFIKKNNKEKTLENMSNEILTAVNLYIETNSEVKKELYNNKNVIYTPLKVLENEGLIDLKNVSYDSNDYVITYLSNDSDGEGCIGAEHIGSWKDANKDRTIYICTNVDLSELNEKLLALELRVDDLESKLADLELKKTEENSVKNQLITLGGGKYVYTGTNPNNYVIFDVDVKKNEFAYFQNNLWRIYSINSDKTITIVSSEPSLCNNSLNKNQKYSSFSPDYYSLKNYSGQPFEVIDKKSVYYKYDYEEGWTAREIDVVETEAGSKKSILYNAITNKNYIEDKMYITYYYTDSVNGIKALSPQHPTEMMKIGVLNKEQIVASKESSDISSWLYTEKRLVAHAYATNMNNEYYGNYLIDNNDFEWQKYVEKHKNRAFNLYTGNYYPVVTLKNSVELKEQSGCNNPGNISCPYILVCSDCN